MCSHRISLTQRNSGCPTSARHRPNWSVLIVGAAALGGSLTAGPVVLDTFLVSTIANPTSFPVNRVAKQDRLPAFMVKRDAKNEDGGFSPSRALREIEGKRLLHCEPVISPLVGPDVRKMPPRSCLARLEMFPQSSIAMLRLS